MESPATVLDNMKSGQGNSEIARFPRKLPLEGAIKAYSGLITAFFPYHFHTGCSSVSAAFDCLNSYPMTHSLYLQKQAGLQNPKRSGCVTSADTKLSPRLYGRGGGVM